MDTEIRIALQTEIELTREKFQRLLVLIPEEALPCPSLDPDWTNAELLWLMSTSPLLIQSILKRNTSWRSRSPSIIQVVTGSLIQKTNELFVRSHARNTTRWSIAKEYEETCDIILQLLDVISDESFEDLLTVHENDPLLARQMTVEELFHYVKHHFDFYRRKISLGN